MDVARMNALLAAAAAEGRWSLYEDEVYAFLAAAGVRTPALLRVAPGAQVTPAMLAAVPGDQVVLKIVSPHIAHKSDVGGVRKVAQDAHVVQQAIDTMLREVPRRFAEHTRTHHAHLPASLRGHSAETIAEEVARGLQGVLVAECVALENAGPGSELLVALRDNREFGPVLTMGVGGVDTELLGEACKRGVAVVSASATLLDPRALLDVLRPTLAYRRLAGLTRARRPLVLDTGLERLIAAFRGIAEAFGQDGRGEGFTLTELEVNPFGASDGALIALDGLLSFRPRHALRAPRPRASLDALMKPRSAAVIGVSSKAVNMGRLILRNIVDAGFPKDRLWVVRPETEEIDGVRCVPTVKKLPERVDLFVVAVTADQVPSVMEELVAEDKAVGVILIPGGMGEKHGGEVLEKRVIDAIARGRAAGQPLVAAGGNSLGIVSRPGRYHTLFIPKNKLPLREDGRSNVALLSQSGAFMISRLSRLSWLSPRYAVSAGNQVDLTLADFLRYLAEDREVTTFAVYAEGFKDGDGLEFARVVREITLSGRDVLFYKAGRTAEGKHATSGHTASLAGDYDVCEAIVARAGAHIARTFDELLELVRLSTAMGTRAWRGTGLAALSNAGYEAVGIADSVQGDGFRLQLAGLNEETRHRVAYTLKHAKLDGLVDVRNPLDLTPMADDAVHEEIIRAYLADSTVDVLLCATIPLTPAMATLAEGVPHEQSIRAHGSLPNRLERIAAETQKPIVVSVDSGSLFDPLAAMFEEKGFPTFRSADAAVRTIGRYVATKLQTPRPV